MRHSALVVSALAFGYAFLYVPLSLVMLYSFNDSRLVTVWGGFSLRWYASLAHDGEILQAARVSLEIALLSATLATMLGTLAGLTLGRRSKFAGRGLFEALGTAPLVMPEIITGFSLLLLFVSLRNLTGWPATRGLSTIAIAHTTFSLAYVCAIVRARVANSDLTLEEAAMDLGAGPWAVLLDITLPLLAPAMLAGWLLAFTLSLDDLVVASFVTGAGTTTLPMLIFSKVRLGVTPDINALATLIILLVAILLATAGALARPRSPLRGARSRAADFARSDL